MEPMEFTSAMCGRRGEGNARNGGAIVPMGRLPTNPATIIILDYSFVCYYTHTHTRAKLGQGVFTHTCKFINV